jgi:CRP/FNR family cyclic AMP-dependent transcriptional regulator
MTEMQDKDGFTNVAGVSRPAPARLLQMLAPLATSIRLRKGQDLFQQGDKADALFVLQDGLLRLSSLAADGRRLNHILLKSGAIFGEIALFDMGPRSATATAEVDLELQRVQGETLLAEMSRNAELATEIARLAIGRLRWMSEQLNDHAFQPVNVRLARQLVFLHAAIADARIVPIGQSDLAEFIGATREAVSKSLADLKRLGIIDIGRGKIEIIDLDALYDLGAIGVI